MLQEGAIYGLFPAKAFPEHTSPAKYHLCFVMQVLFSKLLNFRSRCVSILLSSVASSQLSARIPLLCKILHFLKSGFVLPRSVCFNFCCWSSMFSTAFVALKLNKVPVPAVRMTS